jgi:hypothetical protein
MKEYLSMQRHQAHFLILALGAWIGLAVGEAKAGYIITMSITDDTTSTTTVFNVAKGSANDVTSPTITNAANIITVGGAFDSSATGLNLTGVNSNTNNPGTTNATISLGGTASVVSGVATSDDTYTVLITVSQTSFTSPTGAHGTLSDSTSSTISATTGAAGDMQKIQSWYNPLNTNAAVGSSTPGVSYALPATASSMSLGSPTESTSVSVAPTPYALIERITIVITGNSSDPNAKDVFGGTTTLTASAIPEPASIVMMLTGMPLAIVGMVLRRRRAPG